MIRSYFLNSTNESQFIEIPNDTSSNVKRHVYFSGDYNYFYLEGIFTTNYKSFASAFVIDIEANSSAFLEIQNNDKFAEKTLNIIATLSDETDPLYINVYSSTKKEVYQKKTGAYKTLPKSYSDFQKHENSSFGILRTNPRLTGNMKIVVDSIGDLFLSVIDNTPTLENQSYKKYPVMNGSSYPFDLYKFIGKNSISSENLFNNFTNSAVKNTKTDLKNQYSDNPYKYGAKVFPSQLYTETYSFFAPLFLKKEIPNYFIIYQKKDINKTDKLNYFKDLKIVKVFDLSEDTKLGKYIRALKNTTNWTKESIALDFQDNSYINYTGIDLSSGTIATKYDNVTEYTSKEKELKKTEEFITSGYSRNNMVVHNILNFEFLFDLDDVNLEISSLFGIYADSLSIEELSLNLNDIQELDIEGNPIAVINSSGSYNYSENPDWLFLKNVDSKFPSLSYNDGKHLFYVKSPNGNLYNVLDKGNLYDRMSYLKLDKTIDYSDFACNKETIVKHKDDVISESNPFYYVKFKNNFTDGDFVEFDFINSTLLLEAESEFLFTDSEPIITNSIPLQGIEIKEDIEVSEDGSITCTYKEIQLGHGVTIDAVKTTVITRVENTNDVTFTFDIELTPGDTVTFEYKRKAGKKNYFKIGANLKETLYNLEQTINSDDSLPIFCYSNEESVYFACRTKEETKTFTVLINSDLEGAENYKDVLSGEYHKGSFIGHLGINEFGVILNEKEKNDLDASYNVMNGKGLLNIVPFGDDLYVPAIAKITSSEKFYIVKFKNPDSLLTTTSKDNVEFKKLCKLDFGILSFYDIKDFDVDVIASEWDSKISEEYKRFFGNYKDGDILNNNWSYAIHNTSEDEDASLYLYYYKKGEFDDKATIVNTFVIPPLGLNYFNTFYTTLGLEEGNFYVKGIDDNINYVVFPRTMLEDSTAMDFVGFDKIQNIKTESVKNIIDRLRASYSDKSLTLTTLGTEYDRLRENDTEDHLDIFKEDVTKWVSSEGKDSYMTPYRLNFSRAFGVTNMSTVPSDIVSPINLNYNWFLIDEVPFDVNIFDESTKLYGFGRISKSKILDTSYNYFEEYFNSGNNIGEAFTKRELYSNLYKVPQEETYETFFKGVKYRFKSSIDMSDYKFSILATFNPETETTDNTMNLITDKHCCDDQTDPEGCNPIGILTPLYNAILDLEYGDVSLTIPYSFTNSDVVITTGGYNANATSFSSLTLNSVKFIEDVENAFAEWKTELELIYNSANECSGNLTVTFTNLGYETGGVPIDGSELNYYSDSLEDYNVGVIRISSTTLSNPETLAETNYSSEINGSYVAGEIIFNDTTKWIKEEDGGNGYSVKLTAVHEIGHLLGLGHSSRTGSIMNKKITKTSKYSTLFVDGLQEQECITGIYGFPRVTEDPVIPDLEEVGTYLISDYDSYDVLINHTFKHVVLYISNYATSYTSKGRKFGYTDLYLNKNPKVYQHTTDESDNDVTFRSQDIPLRTGIDFSQVEQYNETYSVKTLNKDFNFDEEIGIGTEKDFYRFRSNVLPNLQVSYGHTSKQDLDTLSFSKTFDEDGNIDRTIFTEVRSDINLGDYPIPFGNTKLFVNSKFYRIRGGEDLDNYNYRLNLTFLINKINNSKLKFTTVGGVSTFEFSVVIPNGTVQYTAKALQITNDNGNNEVSTLDVDNPYQYARYNGYYEPAFKTVIGFGLKDEMSIPLGKNLFKNNTRFLLESEKFGVAQNTPNQKVTAISSLFRTDDKIYPLESKTPLFYKKTSDLFSGVLSDSHYNVFDVTNVSGTYSGINDFKFKKGFLNSLVVGVEDFYEFFVTPSYTIDGNRKITINISDLNKSFIEGVYEKVSSVVGGIFDSTDSDKLIVTRKEAIDKFINNEILRYYSFGTITAYQLNDTSLNTDVLVLEEVGSVVQGLNVSKTDNILTANWDLQTKTKVKFAVKVRFSFI